MKLTNEIVLYILENIGINSNKKSIFSNEFIVDQITLEEDDSVKNLSIYGCNTVTDLGNLNIAGINIDNVEYFLVVKMGNSPSYGIHYERNGNIYYAANNGAWTQANMFLQASFLAGMEDVKNNLLFWSPGVSLETSSELKSLIEFVS